MVFQFCLHRTFSGEISHVVLITIAEQHSNALKIEEVLRVHVNEIMGSNSGHYNHERLLARRLPFGFCVDYRCEIDKSTYRFQEMISHILLVFQSSLEELSTLLSDIELSYLKQQLTKLKNNSMPILIA
jgi:hypothetical protein